MYFENPELINRVQKSLLEGILNRKNSSVKHTLRTHPDSTFVLFELLVEIGGATREYRLWELDGRPAVLQGKIGHKIGDYLFMQTPSKDHLAPITLLQITGFYYDLENAVVAKCTFVEMEGYQGSNSSLPKISHAVASPVGRKVVAGANSIQNELNAIQNSKLDGLKSVEMRKNTVGGVGDPTLRVSHQRFLYTKEGISDTLTALMVTWNSKGNGSKGTLLILDENGRELHRSEKMGYYQIDGITDVDGNLSNELILRSGSEYIELYYNLLEPVYNKAKGNVDFKSHFCKRPPNFSSLGC